jgi:3-hydroxybutyryl-CoA dehydrogenase
MAIETVGVIGAGQMGNGIAHVFALAGHEVWLTDSNPDALGAAKGIVGRNLDRQVAKGAVTPEGKTAALDRIRPTPELSLLGRCDLVIEAATEREAVKAQIFESLVPHLAPHTILASNTSSIPITRLAARTDRPERFLGVHFMNPVP